MDVYDELNLSENVDGWFALWLSSGVRFGSGESIAAAQLVTHQWLEIGDDG